MHTVKWNGQVKAVAATWDELSRPQLRRLLPILAGSYADPHRQWLDVLPVLLGVSQPLLLRAGAVQLVQLRWLTNFLLQEPVGLIRVPLPALRPAWYRRPLFAPGDELAGVCFLEFAYADAYFVAYCRDLQAKWLNCLLGTLYRPQRARYRPRAADYAGDRRADFNEYLVEGYAARLARLPAADKALVFTWYRGCRRALELRYPHVFTPAGEEQAAGHPDGWAFVLREMSGQAFGSFQETGRQPAHQVLAKMNDDIARAEQLRREQEAQQRATS